MQQGASPSPLPNRDEMCDTKGRQGRLSDQEIAYMAQQMGHADATTTLRVYARLMQEGVRLDQKETLQALYDAYGWVGAPPGGR